ncbi:MAG: hypothetical protein NC124_10740 [Clostridium sp.]|nr:hypothetical protein [Clostridium sp.]
MFVYEAKDNVENKNIMPCEKAKVGNIRMPITNDLRIQRKKSRVNHTQIVQRQLYLTTGAKVKNLEDLNTYLFTHNLRKAWKLKYSDFKKSTPEQVDFAIVLLTINDHPNMDTYKKAIELIRSKIGQANKTEQERIKGLSVELERGMTVLNKSNSSSISQGGDFIGDPARWHIHTNIGTQKHLKRGSRERLSLNSEETIITAVEFLTENGGLTEPSGQQCYRWLRYSMIKEHDKDLPPNLRFDI